MRLPALEVWPTHEDARPEEWWRQLPCVERGQGGFVREEDRCFDNGEPLRFEEQAGRRGAEVGEADEETAGPDGGDAGEDATGGGHVIWATFALNGAAAAVVEDAGSIGAPGDDAGNARRPFALVPNRAGAKLQRCVGGGDLGGDIPPSSTAGAGVAAGVAGVDREGADGEAQQM